MSEVINMHVQETIQTGGGVTPTGQISIVENGIVNVAQYATANVQVPGVTPTGKITITENGTDVDIAQYATADINVPQGITPTGTIDIDQNGDVDVTNYATAHVAVPIPQPTGTINITENGTDIDVSDYAKADVAVPLSENAIKPLHRNIHKGYIVSNNWNYAPANNRCSDVYEVTSGHRYFLYTGTNYGDRFNASIFESDPDTVTSNMNYVQYVSSQNPSQPVILMFVANYSGYLTIFKSNSGQDSTTYLFDITDFD